MFRRLYWVTEEVEAGKGNGVLGVYTSIPDLVHQGIQSRNGSAGKLRISLVKLDSDRGPLGVWEGPNFEGIADELQQYVKTDEFSADQCQLLVDELKKVTPSKA